MQTTSRQVRREGKKIGFVPTMGFLHNGHLSLIKKSLALCDVTVVSIYVNPTQFAPGDDLDKYPRDLERDKQLLINLGVDILFLPSNKEIYPDDYQTYVNVNDLTRLFEGEFRPTHFLGVTTIVTILFHSVNPHLAFFGQKDAQQAQIIKQMVKDLKFGIDVIVCPVIRDPDGLALSSRNVYLSDSERRDALILYKSLNLAEELINKGERNVNTILIIMKELINSVASSKLDYVNIVETDKFEVVTKLESGKSYYILIACKIGSTRLIDNTLVEV